MGSRYGDSQIRIERIKSPLSVAEKNEREGEGEKEKWPKASRKIQSVMAVKTLLLLVNVTICLPRYRISMVK